MIRKKSRRQQKIPDDISAEPRLTRRAVLEASRTALSSSMRSQTADFTPATADAALKLIEEAEKKGQVVVKLVPSGRKGKSKLGSVRSLVCTNLDYSLADYTQLGKMLRCCDSLETLELRWTNEDSHDSHYRGARLDNAGLVAMLAGPPLLSVKNLQLYDEALGPTDLPSLDAFPALEHLGMRLGLLKTVGSLDACVSLKTVSIFGLYGPKGFRLDRARDLLGIAALAKLKERGVTVMGGSYWG